MKSYQLVLYASLNPSPPCFVIPIFTTSSSNDTFAQDLLPSSRIRQFMPFLLDEFTVVKATAPALDRRCGENGILAFWSEEDEVICGTASQLKDSLRNYEYISESPFVEVELATFLEDDDYLREAANKATQLLSDPSAKNSYYSRVRKRITLLRDLIDEELHPEDDDNQDISDLIDILEKETDSSAWSKYWHEGWRLFYGNSRLVDIARWRIMTFGLGDDEADVLLNIRYSHSEHLESFYNWWIDHRKSDYLGWVLVWHILNDNNSRSTTDHPAEEVARALERIFDSSFYRRQQWPLLSVWNTCFLRFPEQSNRIIDIAVKNNGKSFYLEYFISMMVMPIYQKFPRNVWARDKIEEWLSKPKGSSLWIDLFMIHGRDIFSSKDFTLIAIVWLRKYGRGTNKWFDLFSMIKPDINSDESWNLRVSWLNRSRKNLYSWPDVFESLADDAGDENFKELSAIAKSWEFRGRNRRRNATIEEFAAR